MNYPNLFLSRYPEPVKNKVCTVCKKSKSLIEFKKDTRKLLGISGICKECHSASSREYRSRNGEKQKLYRRKNKERIKIAGMNYRKNNKETLKIKKKEYHNKNRTAILKKMKLYQKTNPEKITDSRLRKSYGIGLDEYNNIFEKQGGVCIICFKKGEKRLVVDHDHENGKIRGLLCQRCNLAIGHLLDNPTSAERISRYLYGHLSYI